MPFDYYRQRLYFSAAFFVMIMRVVFNMKRCAFLTMDSLANFFSYDTMTFKPLQKFGWEVGEVSWRNGNINWGDYDLVVIRSTWDYQDDPDKFLSVLQRIDDSTATLENSLALVKWNINKTYLRDLQEKGVKIVPSIFGKHLKSGQVNALFDNIDSDKIVIKPVISANADDTFKLDRLNMPLKLDQLEQVFRAKEYIVQPFRQNIVKEGEYSLFYFNGEYSHAILKKPKENDFRVQEEHGGILKSVEPDAIMQGYSRNIIKALDSIPLYARIDFVRNSNNYFELMELELIEPSLYFNMNADSAENFAIQLNKKYA